MPYYDVSAVAEALDMDYRQLDNLLSRNDVAGVERKQRGVSRRLTADAVVVIHLAWELARDLRMPLAEALRLASEIERASDHELALGGFGIIRFDVDALRAATLERLDTAVELVGRRRRGRPVGQSFARRQTDL